VVACGLLGWKLYANLNGPVQCKALSSMGVAQIVCSEKAFLVLSSCGAVYTQNYKSTALVGGTPLSELCCCCCCCCCGGDIGSGNMTYWNLLYIIKALSVVLLSVDIGVQLCAKLRIICCY